jgi:hypothetical protein
MRKTCMSILGSFAMSGVLAPPEKCGVAWVGRLGVLSEVEKGLAKAIGAKNIGNVISIETLPQNTARTFHFIHV